MERKYIIVTGRVQGVGFRYHAMNLAIEYHITGWIRNMQNGGVEMEVQGEPDAIRQFTENLDKDTHWIKINRLSMADMPCLVDGETGFRIRYSC